MAQQPASPFTWTNITAFGMLAVAIMGGSWQLIRQQFDAQQRQQSAALKALEDAEILRHQAVGERLTRLTVLIDEIHVELEKRRETFLHQDEFRQFALRLDDLRRRLDVIEATRPTTGELQGTLTSFNTRLNRQGERLRELEKYIVFKQQPK